MNKDIQFFQNISLNIHGVLHQTLKKRNRRSKHVYVSLKYMIDIQSQLFNELSC